MRLAPLLLAALVTLALYLVVLERDRLRAWTGLGAERGAEVAAAAEPDPALAIVEDAGAAEAEEPEARARVVTQRSEASPVEAVVRVRGRTEAARMVEARAETSGLVASEPLRKGAAVEAGDVLCQLDPGTREARLSEARAGLEEARARLPEAEARVAEAEARVNEARIEDNAARQLSQGGYASETRVAAAEAAVRSAQAGVRSAQAQAEAARSGVQSAQAAVEAAEQELDNLRIRAPFGGLLESDTAELGALLQPGGLCATVIQLDPMRLVGFVPETAVSSVEVGAPARARLATGREVEGAVSFLARSADPATRTFRVEVTVPNDDLAIRDGQTAEIAIEGPSAEAHLLPQSALTLDDDGRLGYRLAVDGRAAFAPVEVLRDTREGVFVTGLPPTAEVIVVGQEFVTEGVPVDAVPRNAAP